MSRRANNILAIASLMICGLGIFPWVQSYRHPMRHILVYGPTRDKESHLAVESVDGEFTVHETHHREEWRIAYWKLCVLSLLPSARWLYSWRRTKQAKRLIGSACSVGDYDLQATPDSCPEAGNAATNCVLSYQRSPVVELPPWLGGLWIANAVLFLCFIGITLFLDLNGQIVFLPEWASRLAITLLMASGIAVNAALMRLDSRRRLIAIGLLVVFATLILIR